MTEKQNVADKVIGEQALPIDQSLLSACIHCGLCLPACPTYLASGRETESPRGRIYLLGQWNEGKLPLDKDLFDHVDSCLGCLGCQTACPSGVQYEKIINAARPFLAEKRPRFQVWLMRIIFKYVLPNYFLLRVGGFFLRIWQALGLHRWLASIAAAAEKEVPSSNLDAPHLMPAPQNLLIKFGQWNAFLPPVPSFRKLPERSLPTTSASTQPSVTGGKVQLFSGCMMDIFYNHVNHAATNLLVTQGRTVDNCKQTCCGALAFHAGETQIAADLARKNIELFESTDGPIAVTAAGCGAMMKEYNHLLADDTEWASRAEKFSSRVVDITEALAAGEFPKKEKAPAKIKPGLKVAYHAACHLAHAQSVRVPPSDLLRLLTMLPGGITLIPLKDAEQCCGSAGIYNLLHPEMALKVLDTKMDNIEKTGADLVVSTNPGCLLQLEAGVQRRGLHTQIKHLCELLADYYC